MVIGASEAGDFEEEVAKYKQDIQEDIEKYKNQEYVGPKWIKEVLDPQNHEDIESNMHQTGSTSSSWESHLPIHKRSFLATIS